MVKKDREQAQPSEKPAVPAPRARSRARAAKETNETVKAVRAATRKPKPKADPKPEPSKDVAIPSGLWVDDVRYGVTPQQSLFISHYLMAHDVLSSMAYAGYDLDDQEDRASIRVLMDSDKFIEAMETIEEDMPNRVGLTRYKLNKVVIDSIDYCVETKDMTNLVKLLTVAGRWWGLEKNARADGVKDAVYTLNIERNGDVVDAEVMD